MKTAALVLALVMIAPSIFAQNHYLAVGLDAGNDEELSHKLVNTVGVGVDHELEIRLAKQCAQGLCDTGGLYRAPSPKDRPERPDILITITCTHDLCFSTLEYWPIRDLGLHTTLGNCIAEGSEAEITQKILNYFVKNTSVEQLAFTSRRFKTLLNEAISMFPKGVK